LVLAQTPSSGTTNVAPADPNQPPQKTAVQQKIEELYRHDGRPLPDYMQNESSTQNSGPQQQTRQQMQQQQQPAAPAANGAATKQGTANQKGSIQQQLSDYYNSQGKTMPRTQQPTRPASGSFLQTSGSNTAGQVSVANQNDTTTTTPPKKPRLIDRLNPFRRTPKATANNTNSGSGNTASGSSANSTAGGRSPSRPQSPSPAGGIPVAPPYRGPDAFAQPAPRPLAPYQPSGVQAGVNISITAAPVPIAPSPVATPSAPDFATTAPQTMVPLIPPAPTSAPTPIAAGAAPVTEIKTATTDAKTPAPKQAATDDVPNPFQDMSETEADKKAGEPYTGLTLDDDAKQSAAGKSAPPAATSTAKGKAGTPAAPASAPSQLPEPSVDVGTPADDTRPAVVPPKLPTAQPGAKPLSDPQAPKPFAEPKHATLLSDDDRDSASKMRQIAERGGRTGLKGFCPVVLRDQRDLIDANPLYSSLFESKTYHFSSAAAKATFDRNPEKYAPVAGGIDILVKANSDQLVEGTLDYAVWYRDHLYLFSSPESLETFSLNPAPYAALYLKSR